MTTDDGTFLLSVTKTRKVKVAYRKDGSRHTFWCPDIARSTYFATDKTKAYAGFVARLKELVK